MACAVIMCSSASRIDQGSTVSKCSAMRDSGTMCGVMWLHISKVFSRPWTGLASWTGTVVQSWQLYHCLHRLLPHLCVYLSQVQCQPFVLTGDCLSANAPSKTQGLLSSLVGLNSVTCCAANIVHICWCWMYTTTHQCKSVWYRNRHPIRPQAARGIHTYYLNKRFMKAILEFSRSACMIR